MSRHNQWLQQSKFYGRPHEKRFDRSNSYMHLNLDFRENIVFIRQGYSRVISQEDDQQGNNHPRRKMFQL